MRPEHRARCEKAIMRSGVSRAVAGKLIDADYQTARLLREASNEELLAIDGIGRGTIKKIRAWVGR